MADDSGVKLPFGFDSIEQYARELVVTYNEYEFLPKICIVAFFVSPQWDRVPKEWQQFFDSPQFDISSLIPMAARGIVPEDAPESLRRYIDATFRLRFPRDPTPAHDSGQTKIVEYFLDGMNGKKSKEVVELSQLIDGVAKETGSRLVVDVGAGQGYLSRVLAYSNWLSRLSVLAVDFSEGQKRGAEALHGYMVKKLKCKRARAEGYVWEERFRERLDHQVLRVDMDSTGELVSTAQTVCQSKREERWMLCGLHACGDLSSAILKAFAESDAAAVVLVPCCYNLISEPASDAETTSQAAPAAAAGFPLSQSAFSSVRLGTNALKTACQATGRWDVDAVSVLGVFKRSYHRALLQYMMVSHGQLSAEDTIPVVGRVTSNDLKAVMTREDVSLQLGKLAHDDAGAGMEFAVYALAALEKMKHPWRPTVAQCVECQHGMKHGLQQVAAAWTLMAMVGPLVESMLVVDRALYLRECCGAGGSVRAFALFDVVESPRNVVLVAQRAGTVGTRNTRGEEGGIHC
ncbi:hypothetical protein LPJ81_002174 [Coemansia sp. IMI 209127]|nr:hypothetical protein LPJ81_002174 [Coemansia sp. IMI 209127]